MKLLSFYLIYECKRKWPRLLIMVLVIAIVIFSLTDILILLESSSLAYTASNRNDTRENHFFSASFLIMLFINITLLITSIITLTKNKCKHYKKEYEILTQLGTNPKKILLIQLIQNIFAFCIAASIALPTSFIFMFSFSKYINTRLDKSVLVYSIPFAGVSLSCIILLCSVILASIISFIKKSNNHLNTNNKITFCDKYPALRMYSKIIRKRCNRDMHLNTIALILVQILPVVFLIAAFSFTSPSSLPHDCVVSINTEDRIPISKEVLQDVNNIPGISELNTLQDNYYNTGIVAIKIKFDDTHREDGIEAVSKLAQYNNLDFSDSYHQNISTSLKNQAYKYLFIIVSGISFIVTLVTVLLILVANLENYINDLIVFESLGVSASSIKKFFIQEAIIQILKSSLFSLVIASTIFAIMEFEGGGGLYITETIGVSMAYLGVQLLVGIISGIRSYCLSKNYLFDR